MLETRQPLITYSLNTATELPHIEIVKRTPKCNRISDIEDSKNCAQNQKGCQIQVSMSLRKEEPNIAI